MIDVEHDHAVLLLLDDVADAVLASASKPVPEERSVEGAPHHARVLDEWPEMNSHAAKAAEPGSVSLRARRATGARTRLR